MKKEKAKEKKEYTINLEYNSTAKSFANMLPQELTMSKLNGNEKYVYLDNTLPENSSNIKKWKYKWRFSTFAKYIFRSRKKIF